MALACKLCVCMWQEAGAVKLPESIHLVVAHQVDLLFQTIWEICYEKTEENVISLLDDDDDDDDVSSASNDITFSSVLLLPFGARATLKM